MHTNFKIYDIIHKMGEFLEQEAENEKNHCIGSCRLDDLLSFGLLGKYDFGRTFFIGGQKDGFCIYEK